MDNIFQIIMGFAKRGIAIDYTVIDQRANGTFCCTWVDKTYSSRVREVCSNGDEVEEDASFDDLAEAIRYAINNAYRYLGETKSVIISQADKDVLAEVMRLADKNVAIDYSIVLREGTIYYGMYLFKKWSFGEMMASAAFTDLNQGMKWAISNGKKYIECQEEVKIVDEW